MAFIVNSGADLTKLNEGFTDVAKPDTHGKFELAYGFDYWDGVPVVKGQTCTKAEADERFPGVYALACARAAADLGTDAYAALSEQRQAVLNDMAYEIGGAGLADFKMMLAYMRVGKWDNAAQSLRNSLLFSQVSRREERNASILISGEWPA